MRILVLSHEYPPIGGGGGKAAQDTCRGLAARGHEVRLLTAHLGDLPLRELSDGFEIIRLRSGRRQAYRAGLPAMAGYVLTSAWAGLRLARAWKPDLIHVHFAVPAGAAAWFISRLTGIPYVITVQLGDVPGASPEKTGGWFRWIYPFTPPIWKSAAAVVAVSEFTRQLALKHYPVEIAVIPNGVDIHKLEPGSSCAGEPPLIVFAGRFVQQKNPFQVVRVLARLRDLPWRCAMLGDGPLRADVEAEIGRLGLRERINLPGWLRPEEVIGWFRQSDILFMPSITEGLPLVGVQALATGLAIVAGKTGGFIDLVEEGRNGALLDAHDEAGFSQTLRELLSDPHRLEGYRRASREIAQRFDLDTVVKSYLHLFNVVGNL